MSFLHLLYQLGRVGRGAYLEQRHPWVPSQRQEMLPLICGLPFNRVSRRDIPAHSAENADREKRNYEQSLAFRLRFMQTILWRHLQQDRS